MTEIRSYKKCQSCAMSIKKDENKGTEANKTLSKKYCRFCYKKGNFIESEINLIEMQKNCAEFFKIEHPIMYTFFGRKYVNSIAKLKRWNKENS